MTEASLLPRDFYDLEPFAGRWPAGATTDERYAQRAGASMEELRALYAAILPRMDAIFEHLDQTPFDEELSSEDQRLYRLALLGAEAASAVEVFNQPDVPFRTDTHVIKAKWTREA